MEKTVQARFLEAMKKRFMSCFEDISNGKDRNMGLFILEMNVQNTLMHTLPQEVDTQEQYDEILGLAREVDTCSRVFEHYLSTGILLEEVFKLR